VDTISGDREQADREATIARFRSGEVTMVIATDVAARGLDISGIDRVINYDYPSGECGSDDYIHRIGRTGRAAAKGAADTLFTPNDMKHAKELARILEDAQQRVPPELLEMATKTGRGDGAGKGKGGGKHPNHRKNRAQ
jgi:ATP-dependent RNA helicase DDX5/DBP2